AAVGAGNRPSNQSATAGWNVERVMGGSLAPTGPARMPRRPGGRARGTTVTPHRLRCPLPTPTRSPPMRSLSLAASSLGLALVLSGAAFAAPTTYTPDPNHTFVRFSYAHMGFSTQESRFN